MFYPKSKLFRKGKNPHQEESTRMIIFERVVKVSKYSIVGLFAAGTHAIVLIILSKAIALWASNLIGFLSGSLVSYLGHSLYTFRKATDGKRFARRWLLIQFTINTSICTLLPIVLSSVEQLRLTAWIFIFTPTVINVFIWSFAAKFSFNRIHRSLSTPVIHADDLGLTNATNKAIFALAQADAIQSASLLVNGIAVNEAIHAWKNKLQIPLTLHISLTEGIAVSNSILVRKLSNHQGCLNQTFSKLLLASFLPKRTSLRKEIELAIKKELLAQIKKFKGLTKIDSISIDGHQHIHLIPIVLDVLMEISKTEDVSWIRTTYEPLPNNTSTESLLKSCLDGGLLKWLTLQVLSNLASNQIKKANIKTNAGFSGVLFTGKMSMNAIKSAWMELKILKVYPWQTQPMILVHPAASLEPGESMRIHNEFPYSQKFFSSPWRQKEWKDLILMKESSN